MYDCIVCGAGPSGMCAAIALARQNKKVLIVERTGLLGGTNILSLVGPLMTFHNENIQVIGGIANEIVERLIQSGDSLGHIKDPFAFCSTITPYTNEALKALYFKIVDEEGIEILLHTIVIGCKKENNKIKSIIVCNTEGISKLEAKVFIDATGNGDLACKANAPFIVGRNQDNLCQPMTMPFVVAGVNFDKVREAIKKDSSNFDADKNYDYKYVGVSGFFKEVQKAKNENRFSINRDRVLLFQGVKKDEAIINTTRVIKLLATSAKERTLAEIEGRKQIQEVFNFLKSSIPGFESSYILTTPVEIGIRETRHIVCDYMLNKDDVMDHRSFDDSIVVGSYPMDIHSPNSDKLEIEEERNLNLAYEIPLRSIIASNNDNLIITGRCIGATHEAAASIRVTPIVMALGEAAGLLASLSIDYDGVVRKVEYKALKNRLESNKTYPTMKSCGL